MLFFSKMVYVSNLKQNGTLPYTKCVDVDINDQSTFVSASTILSISRLVVKGFSFRCQTQGLTILASTRFFIGSIVISSFTFEDSSL
mmetsp:Transcript_3529/g.3936  ORF Transcript_3529/g.3936 Transcript_3529/m.3936 type:complete len:87 (-) Transcript_3529:18-278(-)